MPEFVPVANIPDNVTDPMVRGYLETAEWCGVDEDNGDAKRLEEADRAEWSGMAILAARRTCTDFRELAGDLLEGLDEESVGMDLWLTQNRHGAGFWDTYPGELGDKLTELAHPYGAEYVTVNCVTSSQGETVAFLYI